MRYLLILMMSLLPVFAHAGEAKDMAEDPVLEQRMIGLAEKLRCLVCQNESLASSHADLAQDLRREIRNLIKQGKSVRYMVPEKVYRELELSGLYRAQKS